MLKRDTNGKFCYKKGFLSNKRRFLFQSGKRSTEPYLDEEQYNALLTLQQHKPIAVMADTSSKKRWWMFKNEFYWEDEGYSDVEIMVLILDKIEQKKKKVDRAVVRLSQGVSRSTNGRQPIPDEIKQFVWQRDGGRCVKCGSQEYLEFDHIIPLAKGGSNTSRNIQLLCERCNRAKSANLI